MQSLGPVPMTQCFQQPRAFCQTHLLALLCLCYYLLFEPLIILANSGKVPQDAACWEDTTKLSTISSSSDPDLSPPPLPACTQRHHDQEPRNPRFLVYNRATAYKLFVRAALFCACSWFGKYWHDKSLLFDFAPKYRISKHKLRYECNSVSNTSSDYIISAVYKSFTIAGITKPLLKCFRFEASWPATC